MKKILLLGFMLVFACCFKTVAQNATISGKVSSSASKEPLSGVSVTVKGSTLGTTTDAEGAFTINIAQSDPVLIISLVGFATKEVDAKGLTSVDVLLETAENVLSDVVVVAYGTQKKTSLTSAVSDIKGKELTRRPVSSLGQALQGQIPGLTVLDRGGAPGDPNATFLRVRGMTTLGDNSPLTLVDGVEQRIWDINPNDIETVSVLKDAASTAIYGSRAANGVIIITTKRGQQGAVSVNFNSTVSIQRTINHPKPMDTRSYMELKAVAAANSNRTTIYTPEYIDAYMEGMKTDPLKYPVAIPDWYDAVFSPAPQYDANLSVSGGSKNSTTRFSLRYQDQQGIMATSGFKLYDLRINNTLRIGSKITVDADASYRRTNTILPWSVAGFVHPVYDNLLHGGGIFTVPKYPDGNYGLGTRGNNAVMYGEQGGSHVSNNNLVNGNIKGDWSILKGLKLSSQFGVKSAFNAFKGFQNAYTITDYFNPATVLKTVGPNRLIEERGDDILYTINNLLTYDAEIADGHNINSLLGYSQIGQKITSLGAGRQNFFNNDIQSINAGANDDTRSNYGRDVEFGLRSYFSRIDYNYKEKYLSLIHI